MEGALKMTYQIKQPKLKNQKEDSFEIMTKEEENSLKQDNDLFSMDNKDEKESEKYEEQEKIKEINDDLKSEDSPIRIKDKYTLIVDTQGQKHEVNRKHVAEYYRIYGLEDGSEERPLTSFTSLGNIHGERQQINQIYKDCNSLFSRLDGDGYKTLPSEE